MRQLLLIFMLSLGFSLSTLDSPTRALEAHTQLTLHNSPTFSVAAVQVAQAGSSEGGDYRPREIENTSSSFSIRGNSLLILLLFISTGIIAILGVRYTLRHRRPL